MTISLKKVLENIFYLQEKWYGSFDEDLEIDFLMERANMRPPFGDSLIGYELDYLKSRIYFNYNEYNSNLYWKVFLPYDEELEGYFSEEWINYSKEDLDKLVEESKKEIFGKLEKSVKSSISLKEDELQREKKLLKEIQDINKCQN